MKQKIAIIGSGYVGLTTSVALAYLGHEVTCVDTDEAKIQKLRRGQPTFYEPGLEDLLGRVPSLRFTTSYAEAIPDATVVFIAVGTPSLPDGRPDLRFVESAAREIGRNLSDRFTVLINKSTVPIGSGNWVDMIVRDALGSVAGSRRFAVASNPEFLREGSALHDTFYPDRVVVGADDANALEHLTAVYRPILDQTFVPPERLPRPEGLRAIPLVRTDLASAELIKYASNAFLALKISYINEIAELAERVGADVTRVAAGIGLDGRIGARFLQAGIGWGGSCFGKDTAALLATATEYGLTMPIVQAARDVNYRQRARVVEKLRHELKILKGRSIGLLGLAFKPQTDDLRDAPALDLAKRLLEAGAKVRVHDPVAMPNARALAPSGVEFCDLPEDVARECDALVLVTDWAEYRGLDWSSVARKMRSPLLVDARNFLGAEQLSAAGFRYVGMGV